MGAVLLPVTHEVSKEDNGMEKPLLVSMKVQGEAGA